MGPSLAEAGTPYLAAAHGFEYWLSISPGTHALVRRAGLPRPVAEFQIGRYTADFAWPDEKVIAETDGYGAHGHRTAFEHDRARDTHLLARGWVVMRVTWRRLDAEPVRVVAELAVAPDQLLAAD